MYVLVTIEDDGWQSETHIRGVYSTFELARENFKKVLDGLMFLYQVKDEKELADLTLDFAEYYNGDTWFKVYFDGVEVNKGV